MDLLGSSKKYYIDQQLPNYNQIANAVQTRFPHLRVGIGPNALNDRYLGDDKQQIADFIATFEVAPLVGEPVGVRRPQQHTFQPTPDKTSPAGPKQGEDIVVVLQGIGEIEAKFLRALPDGKVVVDLDGIEETVDASAIIPKSSAQPSKPPALPPEPPKAAAEPAEPPTLPPEPAKADLQPLDAPEVS